MTTLIEASGGGPQKQPKYVPIFMDRAFTGIYTQRAILHDPSDVYTARFYGGRPDALLSGRNVELTNRLTLQRRPGMVAFGTNGGAVYPTPPDRAFSFQLSNGTIRVIIDTGSSGALAISAAANASGSTTVYTGTFPGGASDGYAGLTFVVSGFTTSPINNGTFTCISSTLTTLTLDNPSGIAETIAASAITSGAVYWDTQDGSKTLLWAKNENAGQTYFIAVAGVLYAGDGVDTNKYTPLNDNGTVWNWGIEAPTTQPGVTENPSGSAATRWQINTIFSTMGLTKDTNSPANIWQLISVNALGDQASTVQFGTAGVGEPDWPKTEGATYVESGGLTWLNMGAVEPITESTFYTDIGIGGGYAGENFSKPAAGTATNSIYGNYRNSGHLGETGAHLPAFSGAYPGPPTGQPSNPSGSTNGTNWFAIGSYNTAAQLAAMRWRTGHSYSTWVSTGSNATLAGTPNFIITGNLPTSSDSTVYLFIPKVGGTSSSGYNPFPTASSEGDVVYDNQLSWLCLGPALWAQNHAYTPWTAQGNTFGCIHDGTNFQVCLSVVGTGHSGSLIPGTAIATTASVVVTNSGTQTTFTKASGSWTNAPAAGDSITTSGFANGANNGVFTVVSATTSTIIVSLNTGAPETASATITITPWAIGYGSYTVDGHVTWVCVGRDVPWASAQVWHKPVAGFQPPGPSQQFGGSEVNESGYVQAVINSGKSNSSTAPPWGTSVGSQFNEVGGSPLISWQTVAPTSAFSLLWSFGLAYAYSYKARPIDDYYSPLPDGGGATPPGGSDLGLPLGSETNAISSASPVNQIVGANTGSVNLVTGRYSSDPQVDTIVIWRSADSASGSADMFELTEIKNIPSLANTGPTYDWSFSDYLPSVPDDNGFPGLNILLPAPVDGVNNPPLPTFLPQVYNYQRIWGSLDQSVGFSGGPDTFVGNPNEAFNISDNLPFLAPVIRLVKTPQGIVTFLTDSIEFIGGGPATATFFSVTMAPGVGLLSYNACDVYAGEIYFFSNDNCFRVITPALNLSNFGFPLGDQFANQPVSGSSDATWDPADVYVAVHQNGVDNAIFVADGSTGWYRLNPHQVPGAAQGPEPIWSPFAAITGGCKMVQSVETSPGIKQLLAGGSSAGDTIISRSLTTFTDLSGGVATPYSAYFTMGSITLAHPGQLSILKFLEFDFSGVAYQPTVSYLLNEISGTFTSFVNGVEGVPQFDPPSLYGQTLSPATYSPNRYYFDANNSVARCRHMQVKVDFGTTSVGNELYSMTIFGRLMIEV